MNHTIGPKGKKENDSGRLVAQLFHKTFGQIVVKHFDGDIGPEFLRAVKFVLMIPEEQSGLYSSYMRDPLSGKFGLFSLFVWFCF